MCGGSPLIIYLFYCVWFFSIFEFHVGEIHRVAFNLILRSPLSEPELFLLVGAFSGNSDDGEIHRRAQIYYSRSPLSEPEYRFGYYFYPFLFRCRGDSQGSFFIQLSFSPCVFSPN